LVSWARTGGFQDADNAKEKIANIKLWTFIIQLSFFVSNFLNCRR